MSVVPLPSRGPGSGRRPTSTADFGSGRREAHDASAFYERFVAPEITTDSTVNVNQRSSLDVIHAGDARDMAAVETASVALVVTSPPYFAGKQYEQELGVGGVPADYFEYLDLLREVFSECKRVLEPGGRMAVNVANLGRRPYRSLSGDVTEILSDLGLLLRGEVVWLKGRGATGSCAWGTFQRPANPVLRDVTERIVIASKGRFDRSLTPVQRFERGLPSTTTISRDEFMEATTDLWEIPSESATRVGHPAPFPVELPQRLIELYTYEGDVVLDPFMGSGSTAVAAVRTGRHHIGYDTDAEYVAIAERRVADERARLAAAQGDLHKAFRVELPAVPRSDDSVDIRSRVVREGRQARELAEALLVDCGFCDVTSAVKPRGLGIVLDFVAKDATGRQWAFDVSGAFTSSRAGLRRADTLWRSISTAAVLHESDPAMPLVLLTTDAPTKGSAGDRALKVMRGKDRPVFDVVEMLDAHDQARLRRHATEGPGGA